MTRYRPRRPTRRQVAQALALIEPKKREETSVDKELRQRIIDAAEYAAREHVDTQRHLGDTDPTIARHAGVASAKASSAWVASLHADEREMYMHAFFLRVGRELRAEHPTPQPPAGERGE